MLKCPRCGQRLEVVKLTRPMLTKRQRDILQALEDLERDLQGSVPTRALIAEIGVSAATLKNELAHLEHMEHVCRPNGPKSGWAIARQTELALVIPAA